MLKRRKLATVFLTSLVIFSWSLPVTDVHSLSTTPVSSGLILDGGFDVVPDGAGNLYILSYSSTSDNCNLIYCNNSGDKPALSTVSVKSGATPTKGYISALYNSPYMYIFYPTKVVRLRIGDANAQASDYITVNLDTPKYSQGLAVGANNDVFMCASDSSSVSVYDPSLKDNTNLIATESLSAITTDISKNFLYAATNNTLYRYKISEGSYKFEEATISGNFAPFKFLTDNIFISGLVEDAKICTLSSTTFKLDSTVAMQATMENYPACVAIAGFDNASILAKTAEKVVSRVRCSDGAETGKIEFSEEILAVATSGEKTIVVTGTATATNIHLITASDITEITPPEPEKPPEIGGGTTPDNPKLDTPSETPEDTTIGSTEGYEIGENIISKIPAGTTLGAFKNGLTFDGFSLSLKDAGGNAKTASSTKIATGYTVTFVKDGAEYKKFTLIVEGDVTGSGNISSKSISALANHLLGKAELDGVYKDAANLSGDRDLSTVDLLLMYKQTQK